MHWLCLHFADLPLEVFSRAQAIDAPWIVADGRGRRRFVLLGNASAEAAGIRPGMAVSAACALAQDLRISERDTAAEARALASLAAWAGRFTPLVSLHPPQSLLLEIGGSLRLFGGHFALRREIRRDLPALGFHAAIGSAPTPLAAALLARAGIAEPVAELRELPGALRELPLSLLDLEERQLRALHAMGLHRLGELLRLPRAGLAQRFGTVLLDRIERLLGQRPDPQLPWRAPPRFMQTLTLPAETGDTEALLFPARRLLLELEAFLQRQEAGAQQLRWTLIHDRQSPTHLDVELSASTRDPQHLLLLLRERLAHTGLAHPVVALTLALDEPCPLAPATSALDGPETPVEDWPQLVERLRARLGNEAVLGLSCLADHRPERAWHPAPPGLGSATAPDIAIKPAAERPLWLLADPLPLGDAPLLPNGEPLYPLQGPERIESGWWDGADAARDYYIARDAMHARYWIYRERRAQRRWFLHGHFA
ncbi:MAG: DNA polymerase Y family protein [Gammaproteobacteria bacterium]|jgi:protein ImuB|nr:DNA polymerase Y family protein [Gammaproteobacteria bacterium]